MRKSTILGVGISLLVTAGALPAFAQDATAFGHKGQMILSVDRMFGLHFGSVKTDNGGGVTTTRSATDFSLLWTGGGSQVVGAVYNSPRLAFDYAVADRFTVGGSLGYAHESSSFKNEGGGAGNGEGDGPSASAFLFGPRAGYALPLTPQFTFWPRLGFTYFRFSSDNAAGNVTDSLSGFSLNIEPEVVYTFLPNVGVIGGLVFDIPLSGTAKHEDKTGTPTVSTEQGSKIMNIGLTFGLVVAF